ncbi:hypothetical protein PISL3812_06845 [Talaromyces islandicus]|uniref:Uncharacterized protein n=1 Tax=Talaromyces islandicus TaxID=28573 RepID=A0A0U1M455_TALIS|nr:hypothetical protein PISL3812_06845 [Talaromyces islandicus]
MANWPSSNQHELRNAEITYHGRTLSGVRNALAKLPKQDMFSASHMPLMEEIILTVASVCKYEAVRGNIKSWRGHLEALQSLVDYCGGFKNLDADIADWVSGLAIYWLHITKLTNPKSTAGLVFCDGFYDTPKVDLYLGCSEQLVKICSRISDLRILAHSTATLVQEVTEINNLLVSWSCDEQDFIIPEGISEATFGRLKIIADYYRYGAYIFLHSTLDGISQSNPLEIQGSQSTFWDMIHSLVAFAKPVALQHLVSLLRSFPPNSHPEFSGLVFPLFIAGCECEDNEQLALILKSLHTLEVNFGIHNTKRAQELLMILSQLRCEGKPKHWLDLLEELEWDLMLV